MAEITKEQFEAYEAVRVSGVTNMFDTRTVAMLSGLDREEVKQVIHEYTELRKKYMGREV